MQIYWNKRKRLHKKRVQLPQDWLGTPTWPPFHCFGTPIWPPWRHVKTLYRNSCMPLEREEIRELYKQWRQQHWERCPKKMQATCKLHTQQVLYKWNLFHTNLIQSRLYVCSASIMKKSLFLTFLLGGPFHMRTGKMTIFEINLSGILSAQPKYIRT